MGQPVGAKVESSMTTPASSRASPLPQAHRQPEQRRGACGSNCLSVRTDLAGNDYSGLFADKPAPTDSPPTGTTARCLWERACPRRGQNKQYKSGILRQMPRRDDPLGLQISLGPVAIGKIIQTHCPTRGRRMNKAPLPHINSGMANLRPTVRRKEHQIPRLQRLLIHGWRAHDDHLPRRTRQTDPRSIAVHIANQATAIEP